MTERVRLAGGRFDHGLENGEFDRRAPAKAVMGGPVRVAIVDDDALVGAGV
jgi:hypothetical protein